MDPTIPSVYIPAVMGIIATLFALYIANSILIFQTLSAYKKEFNDDFFMEKGSEIDGVYGNIPVQAKTNTKSIKEKLDQILKHFDNSYEKLNEELKEKEKKKGMLQDSIKNIDEKIQKMKENEEYQIDDLNKELKSKINLLEKLSPLLDEIIGLLKTKNELIDFTNIKNFNYRYDKRIRSFNDIFVILSIFVITFEVYNGMLLYYYNPKILMNFTLSFVYFVTLVVVIVGVTCDFLYYTVYSQNPRLFGNNYRTIFISMIILILLCTFALIAIFHSKSDILNDFLHF